LNNVDLGNGIKAINGIPLLYIHYKCALCKIGNGVTFRSYQDVCWNSKCYLQVKKDATFIIGDNSGLSGTMIFCSDKIEIGDNVMIGGGCRIFDTDFHPIQASKRLSPKTVNDGAKAPVIIEDNVFIGTNCIIGKGVRIGQGSVIAAGSVVVKSIPANEIWGGNPARFIRKID
jgi:acetyltransferase-like isoleucine patch superfamily enzyme